MSGESKYYYITDVPIGFSSTRTPRLEKWNSNFNIEVEENVDFRQYLSISIDKLLEKQIPKSKSTKFQKVRPIIKEIFLKHYSLAIKYIAEEELNEG